MSKSTGAKRIAAGAAAASLLAGGFMIAGAGAAQAESMPGKGYKKLKAPNNVTAGVDFTLKCKLDESGWETAKVKEKGVAVHATRTVNGKNCTFTLDLDAKGMHEIRVITTGPQNVIKSHWLTVNVK